MPGAVACIGSGNRWCDGDLGARTLALVSGDDPPGHEGLAAVQAKPGRRGLAPATPVTYTAVERNHSRIGEAVEVN